jgi:hypothetical protein
MAVKTGSVRIGRAVEGRAENATVPANTPKDTIVRAFFVMKVLS